MAVKVQERRARLFKGRQPLPPRRLAIVFPLRQRLARHVVPAAHLGVVEAHVVDPAGWRVDPPVRHPADDDLGRRHQLEDQVHRQELRQRLGLHRRAREAVEDEGAGRVV